MFIKWIEYENTETGFKIEKTSFERMNLLVGLSGAGKTQILNAVEKTARFISGRSSGYSNIDCSMEFSIGSDSYEYHVKTGSALSDIEAKFSGDDSNIGKLIIEEETLSKNSSHILSRNYDKIEISGYESIPKAKDDESTISLFSKDKSFSKIREESLIVAEKCHSKDALEVISSKDYQQLLNRLDKEENKVALGFVSLGQIPPYIKYGILNRYDIPLCKTISDAFTDIFASVEDVKFDKLHDRDVYCIFIKENGTWIEQKNISSGMLKALGFIIELYTAPKNAVILIDEFENSLGVNCIDTITDLILNEREDIQFLITSHHPYIINHVPMEYWKIVTRKGAAIRVRTAPDLNIGNSKHEAFIQLMNKLMYGGDGV